MTVVLGEHDRNVPSGDEVRIVASEIIVVSLCFSMYTYHRLHQNKRTDCRVIEDNSCA